MYSDVAGSMREAGMEVPALLPAALALATTSVLAAVGQWIELSVPSEQLVSAGWWVGGWVGSG